MKVCPVLALFAATCLAAPAASASDFAEFWRTTLDGTASDEDTAVSLVFDGAGDVLVAGSLRNTATMGGFGVVKLAGDGGEVLWSFDIERGNATAVDVDADDNVIAAGGFLFDVDDFAGFAVVKVRGASGLEEWRVAVAGEAGGGRATSVAVDGAGDIVVAGNLKNTATEEDFAVVKLSGMDGQELWRHVTDGSGTPIFDNDEAAAIALDGFGDVIAVGELSNDSNDFFAIKIDGENGSELWRKVVDGSAGSNDRAMAVVLDASGNPVIAGYVSNTDTNIDFAVVKLSGETGAELWRTSIDGSAERARDFAFAVAVDGVGDVVAVGDLENEDTEGDFGVVKLRGDDGHELWRVSLHGTGSESSERGLGVAIDAERRVFVAGRTRDITGNQMFTVAALAGESGEQLWRADIDGAGDGPFGDSAEALALAADGNPVVVGRIENEGTGGDFAVVKVPETSGPVGALVALLCLLARKRGLNLSVLIIRRSDPASCRRRSNWFGHAASRHS